MTIVLGIDGGLDGGVTRLRCYDVPEEFGGQVAPFDRGPISYITPTIGEGKRSYDLARMIDILRSGNAEFAFLEFAQAMPSRGKGESKFGMGGTKSAFSQGFGHGAWQMALTALRIPYEIVKPRTWQKDMFSGVAGNSDTKAASALVCHRLWPTVDWRRTPKCKLDHDGKTDSACIAEWGRRQLAQRTIVAGLPRGAAVVA